MNESSGHEVAFVGRSLSIDVAFTYCARGIEAFRTPVNPWEILVEQQDVSKKPCVSPVAIHEGVNNNYMEVKANSRLLNAEYRFIKPKPSNIQGSDISTS